MMLMRLSSSLLCVLVLCTIGAPTSGLPLPQASGPVEEWVHVPVRLLFAEGSSSVDDMARTLLREMHASLAHRTDIVQIQVEGHTNPSSSEANNSQLALNRARNVVAFMVNELGMAREQIKVVSYGSTRPVTQDHAHSVQNRRVEFSILVRRSMP